jgi:transcriptional regulator with PAS, ATPase and Fis domain
VDQENLKKWENYHKDTSYRKDLREQVKNLWNKCDAYNIEYNTAYPEKVSDEKFKSIKKNSKRLFVYSNSILNSLVKENSNPHMGAVLFSKEGCILKIYGKEEFLKWAKHHNLEEGTIWDEEGIGPNVFSMGKKFPGNVYLEGIENYSKSLIEGSYYFQSIALERSQFHGGLTIVTPYTRSSSYLRSLVTSIARSIELQIFWFDITEHYSNIIEDNGLINIDKSDGDNRILTMSKEIFKMLNIRPRDAYYERLEDIITTKKNKDFWDIINNSKIVKDKMINLTVGKTSVYVSITTSKFKEYKFNMNGLVISFTSSKRISKIVSQHSGNSASFNFDDIIGESENYKEIIKQSKIASKSDSNILLSGESGVGKDVLAQAIHNNSKRVDKPFVAINCASFSKELIGSELFGYEDGAFTGAKKGGSIGKFELANNGTLFLDEIGDMPLDLQSVLLRAIEQKCITKIGGNEPINVDVRIIAATNKDLFKQMSKSLFRTDLYYRLGIIRIHLPPLRERGEDVELLANHFIKSICERVKKPLYTLSPEALYVLGCYNWPGNVRELKNLFEGIINTREEKIIDKKTIEKYLSYESRIVDDSFPNKSKIVKNSINEIDELDFDEEERIRKVLKAFRNNKTKTAKYLGISRKTLYKRLKEYDIDY